MEYEDSIKLNKLREKLLSIRGMNYSSIDAQKLIEISSNNEGKVLGISWLGARLIFSLFEKISINSLLLEWNINLINKEDNEEKQQQQERKEEQEQEQENEKNNLFTLKDSSLQMSWIVKNIIIPQTIESQQSLLYLLYGLSSNEFPLVGVANYFHSYTWNEEFKDTYTTLDQALCTDIDRIGRYIWWDIFCQNQHIKGDVGASFQKAINQVSKVMFSIPNLARPQGLGRVWCLYEITHAISTPTTKLELIQNYRTHQKLENDPMQSVVDVRDANCFYPEDKIMLLKLMEETIPNGCDGVNQIIRDLFIPLYLEQCLFDITRDGDINLFRQIVEVYQLNPKRIKQKDNINLVHIAASHQSIEILRYLLELEVDVNCKSKVNGVTPLHEAVRTGNIEITELLILAGAEVDEINEDYETPLHFAAYSGHLEVCRLLLLYGANPLKENQYDELIPRFLCMLGFRGGDEEENDEEIINQKKERHEELLTLLINAENDWRNNFDEEGSSDEEDV